MKRLFLFILPTVCFLSAGAQPDSVLHEGKFRKGLPLMRSNPYKPDVWEKPYYETALKTAFPSDLNKFPDKYRGKLIHLIGIVDSVYVAPGDSTNTVRFILENKYWDYIEDYSIEDEVMFVSPKGGGKFLVKLTLTSDPDLGSIEKFATEHKLFLVYGSFNESVNNLPVITAHQIKYIPYELYTTNVFSYEVDRDNNGDVKTDKKGRIQMTNFNFLKVAKAGQNK